jgi:protoporphyrinogen oxidase
MPKKVVILGGGACGLSAAWELIDNGCLPTIIERMPLVGGLASCVERGGNFYEFGTHVFHTDQDELRKRVVDLVGDRAFSFERGSRLEILFRDRYYKFPLNGVQVVRNLPPNLAVACILSFLKWFVVSTFIPHDPRNTEEYLTWHFGAKLFNIFFEEYTKRFWGIPCNQLDARFGRDRIPRSDVFRVLHDLIEFLGLQRIIDRHPLVERSIGLLYYTPRGLQDLFQCIAEHIEAKGGTVLTQHNAVGINMDGGRFRSVTVEGPQGQQIIDGDYLISTMPLNGLVKMMQPLPPDEVLTSADSLSYMPLKVCGLLIDKPQVRKAICTYYQNLIFNRLSEPTVHGLVTTPLNKSILLAEMTPASLNHSGIVNDQDVYKAVVADLVKMELIEETQILDSVIMDYDAAYPIYRLGFDSHVSQIQNYLATVNNLTSTGRQGRFAYINIHNTMKMGIEAARQMLVP